ncbi:MAG: HD-GYP domain-containing protein [Nitrospirota bacterium]
MPTKYKEIEEPDVPVPVEHLIVGTRLPCTIFCIDDGTTKPLFNRDMLFTGISLNMLKEKNITEVYIYMKDTPLFEQYLSKNKTLREPRDTDSSAAFKEYAFYKEQYHQIDSTLIIPGTKIHFSLSMLDKFSFTPLIEASPDAPAEVGERIATVMGDMVIKKSDIPLYYEYLNALWQYTDSLDTDRQKVKAVALKETAKIIVKDLIDDPRSGEKLKKIGPVVSGMIDSIMKNKDTIYDLLSLKGYDYYTYTHSVNVAALAISLGIAIGLKRAEVERLGIGAMLHDIGKSVISHEILHKQGKLDDREYRIIQSHVIEGERILRAHKEFPEEAFSAVLQHHEKLSGRGYPFRLSGKEITPFGRITAIADCYDALTTRRPYKPALTPFYALSVIAKETGNYDPDLLKIFIKMLGKIK